MAGSAAPRPLICRGCWGQMRVPVPIRGPLALPLPLRAFGIRRSGMRPHICTVCELMFGTVLRRRNVELDLTISFADLRGFTALSREVPAGGVREILDFPLSPRPPAPLAGRRREPRSGGGGVRPRSVGAPAPPVPPGPGRCHGPS